MKFHHPDNKEVLPNNALEHHVIASISPDLSKYVEAISSHDPLMLTRLMDGRTSMSKGTSAKCPPAENMKLCKTYFAMRWWGKLRDLTNLQANHLQTYSQNTKVKCWPPSVAKKYLNTFSVHLTFCHLLFYTALTIKDCRPLTTLRYKC